MNKPQSLEEWLGVINKNFASSGVWFTALQVPQEKLGILYIPIMSSMEPHGEPQSYYRLSRIDLNL